MLDDSPNTIVGGQVFRRQRVVRPPTKCSSEKHLFRLLVDEQIVGAEKRGLRRWCLKHQAWYVVTAQNTQQ